MVEEGEGYLIKRGLGGTERHLIEQGGLADRLGIRRDFQKENSKDLPGEMWTFELSSKQFYAALTKKLIEIRFYRWSKRHFLIERNFLPAGGLLNRYRMTLIDK